MIQFDIDQWRAWAPGVDHAAAWTEWAHRPVAPGEDVEPDVSFLPAMQRRRLSRLARMVFSVAMPLVQSEPPMPLVFASRHGETPRTFAILSDLARNEALSPTQFSLSVHNAIIGLWSILQQDNSEMTALAAEGDGLEHAVMEAALLLKEGAPAVLLVIAEDTPPAAYQPWITDVPFPYAVALLLKPGQGWQLGLSSTEAQVPSAQWPHALELVQALATGRHGLQHQWKRRLWTWQQPR